MTLRYKIAAFAVLHELTAIVPLPMIYYSLKWTDSVGMVRRNIPEEYMQKGRKFAAYFGASSDSAEMTGGTELHASNANEAYDGAEVASTVFYLAASYAIVKVYACFTRY
jgi:hypothetical protein